GGSARGGGDRSRAAGVSQGWIHLLAGADRVHAVRHLRLHRTPRGDCRLRLEPAGRTKDPGPQLCARMALTAACSVRNRYVKICTLPSDTGENDTMGRIARLITGFVFLFGVAVAAQNPGGSEAGKQLKNPVAATPESIKAGQALFQKNCRFCHGADAKGNGPMAPEGTHPSNLTDDKWERGSTDGEIFMVIRDGA